MSLRLIFMGTPEFAVPTLVEIERKHKVVAVYTPAPRPAGKRGLEMTPSPIEREARRLGLPVFTPRTLRDPEAQATFVAHEAQAAVVVAYGLILPKPILDAPEFGCFNLHASLLPRWRGAAPINRAIMKGHTKTGVRVMKMDEGLDTGPIARGRQVTIGRNETAGELHDRLAPLGAEQIMLKLRALERGLLKLRPQSNKGMIYAPKIDRNETRIKWELPWRRVHNHIRGLSPFPGAWFEILVDGKPVRVKVLRTIEGTGSGPPGTLLDDRLTIACKKGAVRIVEFLRGALLKPGTRFD
jgi:methionyl-tRNA formyltransferase